MKMFVTVVCAFALLVNVSGCGSKLKGEAEVQELIKLKKEVLEQKDPAKAMEIGMKAIAIMKKLEDLKLTPEEQKKLEEKYPELKDKK